MIRSNPTENVASKYVIFRDGSRCYAMQSDTGQVFRGAATRPIVNQDTVTYGATEKLGYWHTMCPAP